MVNKEFIALCSKAWGIQILAYIYKGHDARVTPISHHFSTGRTSISSALDHLLVSGYIKKNAGHGHPLRPAFLLTKKGKKVARWAVSIDEVLVPNDWTIARKSWVLPILRQSIPVRRFGELRAELKPVTDRALSETLKRLSECQWVHRQVDTKSSPPGVSYEPYGTGKILIPSLKESLIL